MKDYGKYIRMMRKSRNMTQRELASRLGIVHTHVSKWENNTHTPSLKHLIGLAKAFRTPFIIYPSDEEK